MKNVGIIGLGHYLPKRVLTNFDLEKMVETSDEWIISRTGIKQRRIAGKDEKNSDMAIKAGREALKTPVSIPGKSSSLSLPPSVPTAVSRRSPAWCKRPSTRPAPRPSISAPPVRVSCTRLPPPNNLSKTAFIRTPSSSPRKRSPLTSIGTTAIPASFSATGPARAF